MLTCQPTCQPRRQLRTSSQLTSRTASEATVFGPLCSNCSPCAPQSQRANGWVPIVAGHQVNGCDHMIAATVSVAVIAWKLRNSNGAALPSLTVPAPYTRRLQCACCHVLLCLLRCSPHAGRCPSLRTPSSLPLQGAIQGDGDARDRATPQQLQRASELREVGRHLQEPVSSSAHPRYVHCHFIRVALLYKPALPLSEGSRWGEGERVEGRPRVSDIDMTKR